MIIKKLVPLLSIPVLGYGAYSYLNSGFLSMKIDGECLTVKVEEKYRAGIKLYLRSRGGRGSPLFPVALGDYSTGKDYYEGHRFHDADGPFLMGIRASYNGSSPSIDRVLYTRMYSFIENCSVETLPNGLMTSTPEPNTACGAISKRFVPVDRSLDARPTFISCDEKGVNFNCTMKIYISDDWDVYGHFKKKYINHWADIRSRMISYSEENFRTCSLFEGSPL